VAPSGETIRHLPRLKSAMQDTAEEMSEAAPETEESQLGLIQQVRLIFGALSASRVGRILTVLVAIILAVIIVTAYGQILLNRWNRPFFDALSRRDFHEFLVQLGMFFIIAGSLLVLNVVQRWLVEMLKVKLREGLVLDLLRDWLQPRRAFWLAHAGPIGVNPDQRMHEDARKLCELSADLGTGLLQASILFGTFAGVLWLLSGGFIFRIGERDYEIPGFMLWAAVLYAGAGSLLSYWVGRSLIHRNAQRYAREADLRFSLVRVNEHLDGISLARGEPDEMRRVELHLVHVLSAMRRIVTGLTNLTWVTAGFGWITIVTPILVAAPQYFAGKISFGGLMMAAAAFTQAQSSLRWFVDNFSVIADWRATLLRVASFRHALITTDVLPDFETRIAYAEGEPGVIAIDELQIESPSGSEMLKEKQVAVRAGERILIVGAPGTGKSLLFRALAGLWPYGSGRVTRPKDEQILYLPRGTPYLPRGTLREVLSYPLNVDAFEENVFAHALSRLRLERLAPLLDATRRWDRELSQDEQLSLAFARVVLQAPPWVFIDDMFGSLDDETLERVVDIFAHELKQTGLIHVGRAVQARDPLFSRVLHLVKAPVAHVLVLCALFLLQLVHSAAFAQDFDFRAPAAATEASVPALMRDLAVRVLPVYQENDPERYLTNLSALQLVAGNEAAAGATRQSLRDRRRNTDAGRPVGRSVVYDIYARAKAMEATDRVPFPSAFAQSFRDTVSKLNDLEAYNVTGWLGTPLPILRDTLQRSLDQRRGKSSLTMTEAVDLIRTYLAFDAHRSFAHLVDALVTEDDRRRYEADWDVLIDTPGGSISAVVVRPKSASDPLPALLEFTIHVDTQNYAKESAAHGYAGLVAFTRGERRSQGRVVPYQHDGDDVRAVINWITQQPWSNGSVGMYGAGYSAFTQWAAAKRLPPALKAIATTDATAPGIDFPMTGNIFRNSAYRWASCVTGAQGFDEKTCNDDAPWRALDQSWYTSGKPYRDLDVVFGQPSPILRLWLSHPSYDRYWQKMIPDPKQLAHINIPVLATTGYFAGGEAGALYYFTQHYRHDPHANHTLLIGPYDEGVMQHGPAAVLRGLQVDPVALVDLHELRYQWFDHVLRGGAKPSVLQDRVNYQVMGTNQWRHAASLEAMAKGSLKLYLDPGTGELHRLIRREASRKAYVLQTVNFAERGDATWTPQSDLFSKALPTRYGATYVSGPFTESFEINGPIAGKLDLLPNKMDADLSVALYELLPSGEYLELFDPPYEFRASFARNRSQRYLLRAGERQLLPFKSERMTSRKLRAGSRLVLVLGVNKRPDHQINYGTGGDVSLETLADGEVPLEIRWYGGSYVELPVRK